MIKSRHSTVIVISLLSCSWFCPTLRADPRELQPLPSEDVHSVDELVFQSQEDRLSDTQSKLIALQEELSALRKSLRCIQCETDSHDQVSPLSDRKLA